jgi:predicted XRE-type DNA-binding protein
MTKASDFHVLLEELNKNGAVSSQPAVQRSLLRATRIVEEFLHFITQNLFSKKEVADRKSKSPTLKGDTEPTLQVSQARVSKLAWLCHEKGVVKYRDSLREARASLVSHLMLANTYVLS